MLHNAIEETIGQALLPGAIASIAPTNAPMLKRKVPAREDAVPAICGKSSRITAMAFEEIMAIHPR
ncbi:hypothetical protein D3C76_1771920 [compost metagenome]